MNLKRTKTKAEEEYINKEKIVEEEDKNNELIEEY